MSVIIQFLAYINKKLWQKVAGNAFLYELSSFADTLVYFVFSCPKREKFKSKSYTYLPLYVVVYQNLIKYTGW